MPKKEPRDHRSPDQQSPSGAEHPSASKRVAGYGILAHSIALTLITVWLGGIIGIVANIGNICSSTVVQGMLGPVCPYLSAKFAAAPPPAKHVPSPLATPHDPIPGPVPPIVTPRQPLPAAPDTHNVDIVAPPAPSPCVTATVETLPVSFYVQAAVSGASEIGADSIEKSISSYLPSAAFHSSEPVCASLSISAHVHVRADSDAGRIVATTRMDYTDNRANSLLTVSDSSSAIYDINNLTWSTGCAVSGSIYKAMKDDRLAKFLLADFRVRFNVSAEAERLMSQCGADPQAFPQP